MDLFFEISVIILVATAMAGLMRLLKQPLIVGHIITGILVGPHFFNLIHSQDTIKIFSQFGIAILLFIVGLNLSPKIIREVGKISLITGIGQVVFTALIGFLISKVFGFSLVTSLYISIAITFSSTIIILKLLTDKKDTEKLYGKISIGILLVQDVIATIALLIVSAFSDGKNVATLALLTAFKGLILTAVLIFISAKILPRLSAFFANSQEYLFLFSISWGLGMAALFHFIGFSIEIGALIAGVTLSVSPFSQEIGSKLKPLRDFFILMFFIYLGISMNIDGGYKLVFPIIAFSLFVLILKPLIVIILMEVFGYNKKTSFQTGLTIAQISEFSLILVLLGVSLGHISNEVLSLVTFVGLITISGSTYLILYSDSIYPRFVGFLTSFERKSAKKETDILGYYDVILFGCNRVGYDFLEQFKNLKQGFLVVDFDPKIISRLTKEGYNSKYGDAEDAEFLEEINLEKSKLIISTIPDFETNQFLLSNIRKKSQDVVVILISYNVDEAIKFYEGGASYVMLPHFIGGQFISYLTKKNGYDVSKYHSEREKHVSYLKTRKSLGHSHPNQVAY